MRPFRVADSLTAPAVNRIPLIGPKKDALPTSTIVVRPRPAPTQAAAALVGPSPPASGRRPPRRCGDQTLVAVRFETAVMDCDQRCRKLPRRPRRVSPFDPSASTATAPPASPPVETDSDPAPTTVPPEEVDPQTDAEHPRFWRAERRTLGIIAAAGAGHKREFRLGEK